MTIKDRQFFQEKKVTPSVVAPGDTDPSDTTVAGILAVGCTILLTKILTTF